MANPKHTCTCGRRTRQIVCPWCGHMYRDPLDELRDPKMAAIAAKVDADGYIRIDQTSVTRGVVNSDGTVTVINSELYPGLPTDDVITRISVERMAARRAELTLAAPQTNSTPPADVRVDFARPAGKSADTLDDILRTHYSPEQIADEINAELQMDWKPIVPMTRWQRLKAWIFWRKYLFDQWADDAGEELAARPVFTAAFVVLAWVVVGLCVALWSGK